MANINTELALILIGVALAVLLQAGVLLALFLTVRKAVHAANEQAEDYRGKLAPLLETGGQLLSRANEVLSAAEKLVRKVQAPLETATVELATMVREMHADANRLQASVDEVAAKARHQADRVDGMVSSFLNGVDQFGHFLNESVRAPFRQVNGIVSAAKAVIETLRAPAPPRSRHRPTPPSMYVGDDKDLFV
jgi:methyl-accepting chemotaxis protein